ncbi:MAG: Rpn family recombination-promoting nuclease/putative transposase [Lachnospiraceae bacterium]|nr:Rpn family recombination-promoting nuclease/putative transposase [Lachnospiraceae bacterium]
MYDKEYSQLTFVDDFMFCKILSSNKDLCKALLELTLGIKIKKIEIVKEQTPIEQKYDARGIRLDIYVEDEDGTVYDIEMQTTLKKDLPKRTRYYQGMIDLQLIGRKADFKDLKRTYIIFICMSDPFGKQFPVYTFDNRCKECPELMLGDEATKVVINASGNRDNLSPEMKAFLDLLQSGVGGSAFTRRLQEEVEKAKNMKNGRWNI